ncbi:MAG: hypothetical protein AB7Q29_15630 [Vicinamibacterales bacterium]
MAHNHSHEPHAHPQGTVEPDAVNVRGILGMTAGLIVVTILAHVAMYFTFNLMAHQIDASNPPRMFPVAPLADEREPPQPRLQTDPKADLADLRAGEEAILNGYQWVDRNRNVVRIPIADAMRLTLQRGFPVRGEAAPETESQTESSDGAQRPTATQGQQEQGK